MQLAILSDIHDHVWNLRAALSACNDADALICCGDLCSPFIVNLLAHGFPGRIHIVFGNNDGDQLRIAQNAARHGGRIRLYGEFAILRPEEFGIRIAVNHYPAIAEGLAASGKYDLVCYGHDHTLRVDGPIRSSDARPVCAALINPGAIMGYDPIAGADVPSTFVKLDTAQMVARTYEVQEATVVQVRSQELSDPRA